MPMLDGVHLDIGGPAVLSPNPGLLDAHREQHDAHLHAGLGEYGSI